MPEKVVPVKIELEYIEPKIWRRVVVSVKTDLATLHGIIQIVFRWNDNEAWYFEFGGKWYGTGARISGHLPNVYEADSFRLDGLLRMGMKRMNYRYDFVSNWPVLLIFGKSRDSLPGETYPQLVGGARNGPPEDVGGVRDYYRFIDSPVEFYEEGNFSDSWWDSNFDPEEFDIGVYREILKERYG